MSTPRTSALVGQGLGALLESPDANKKMLAPFKVEVSQESQAQRKYQPIDENGIDWAAFKENWGVDREQLEKSGDLDKMLNYGKSVLSKSSPHSQVRSWNSMPVCRCARMTTAM